MKPPSAAARGAAVAVAVLGLLAAPLGPGAEARGGSAKIKTLGTDPSGDAPPSLDLVSLGAGRAGSDLEIRIGLDGILPVARGVDTAPGIQWAFQTDAGRRFVAEAYLLATEPQFLLFEARDGSYAQVADVTGTWEESDGFIRILVPLEQIGARRGTVISGNDDFADHDANSHLDDPEVVIDALVTTKSLRLR